VVATGAVLGSGTGQQVARVVVGRWDSLRNLLAAKPLIEPPSTSGVFARFAPRPGGGVELQLLNDGGKVAQAAPPGTGLVAAREPEGQGPVWIVTGIDDAGVARAVGALSEGKLHDAFAVAATPSAVVRLPVVHGGGG
jgi:hypothetical protein